MPEVKKDCPKSNRALWLRLAVNKGLALTAALTELTFPPRASETDTQRDSILKHRQYRRQNEINCRQ